ncbi:MAG: prolipoprotein diacylglyceryl transferase [Candidatus Woesearchaeota archaeon]
MFTHNINPILFELGPLQIRYYGLLYLLGFVIGYFLIKHMISKRKLNLSNDEVLDYIFWIALGTIIGARLFYTLVYNPSYYLSNLTEILYIWQGGLSFHGGFIGACVAVYLFCKKNKLNLLEMADITILPLALALSLGRIANFINAELIGTVTNVSWCVIFPGEEVCRHPSQLYASFKNIIIFIFLWSIKDLKKIKEKPGLIFGLFILLYSFFRFIVEFYRSPDIQLGYLILNLTMGQLLSIVMFILSLAWIIHISKLIKN